MLEICAIASGSNGNCYYIGNENDAVLVDAGISAKNIVNRMKEKGLLPSKVKALFISHEHADHMRGARVFGKKLNIPVYITVKTWHGSYKNLRPDQPKFFVPGGTVAVGDLEVISFTKKHDAAEPCSFRVEHRGISVGIFTDIGTPCDNVTAQIARCDALFLETNYDEKMLWEGRYPWHLKKRIASDFGHLSNRQALSLLGKFATEKLKCIFLSHLSKENNTPEIALREISVLQNRFQIKLTSRYEASEVYVL